MRGANATKQSITSEWLDIWIASLALAMTRLKKSSRHLDQADKRVADDHEQKPRTELADGDQRPAVMLRWIDPGLGKGADIFGKPDEQRDQQEAEQQRH